MTETVAQLLARTEATRMVEIVPEDRREFARALVLQGYDAPRAHRMAYVDLMDNDGALQMLARHRRGYASHAVSALIDAARATSAIRPTNWEDDEDPEQAAAWKALDQALATLGCQQP